MDKDKELKNFAMGENPKSGLELRLQFMPRFFLVHPHDPNISHTHDYYQIIWFQSGHGVHRVDFKDYPVGLGAVNMLKTVGIELHAGAPAIAVDDVVKQYLDGTIEYGDSSCHHDACGK